MPNKKTKIICTIGPSSGDPKTLKALIDAGMDCARLNMSHGGYDDKVEQILTIRKISKEIGQPITIFADLQGPKMRLGKIDGIREIKKSEILQLSLNPVADEIPIQFDLSPFVKKGQRIYLNDGLVEIKVLSVSGKTIKTQAQNDGVISSNKGINLPDTLVKNAALTEKDLRDAEWAIEQNVDYIALSFIQTVDDINQLKQIIKRHNSNIKIISKIEKTQAVENIEAIIAASDMVMVARGDLAIETSAAQVPVIQQKIIRLCRQMSVPVIIATQMLESMVENPRPTRAEASDVANAVLDQSDCVMLSAETATGKYPVEVVKTMREISNSVESHPDYQHQIEINWEYTLKENLSFSAIASAANALASRVNAKAIVVTTTSGRTARLLAAFRPKAQVVAIDYENKIRQQLNLVWGMQSLLVEPIDDYGKFLDRILKEVKDHKIAGKGDRVVVMTGSTVGTTGATDTIKLATL